MAGRSLATLHLQREYSTESPLGTATLRASVHHLTIAVAGRDVIAASGHFGYPLAGVSNSSQQARSRPAPGDDAILAQRAASAPDLPITARSARSA